VLEVLLAGGLLAALLGGAALVSLPDWDTLLAVGVTLIGLGLLLGLPAALWYHVRLYRAAPAAVRVRGWWWHPTQLHAHLGSARSGVMRWFYVGAACWCIAIAGCVLVGVAAWRS
jgi:hypothetical protein